MEAVVGGGKKKHMKSRKRRRDDRPRLLLPKGIIRRCEVNCSLCLLLHNQRSELLEMFDWANMFQNQDSLEKCNIVAFGRSGILLSVLHELKTVRMKGKKSSIKHTKLPSALKFSVISREQDPDNLFYEAMVGREQINHFSKRFPLFTQTYHLYHLLSRRDVWMINQYAYQYLLKLSEADRDEKFPDDPYDFFVLPELETPNKNFKYDFEDITQKGNIDKDVILRMFHYPDSAEFVSLKLDPDHLRSFRTACRDSRQLVMQTELVPNSIPLMDYLLQGYGLNITTKSFFWNYDCANILFQVYAPLAILREKFTHYDLHLNNVLVSQFENQYIILRYHYKGKTLKIASKVLLKMIDYGRCYTPMTPSFLSALCKSCKPNCGTEKGFYFLNTNREEAYDSKTYIQPSVKNISHDLRLAYLMRKVVLEKEEEEDAQIFDRNDFPGKAVRNLLRNVHFEEHFGTPERPTATSFRPQEALLGTASDSVHRVLNVKDMFDALFSFCSSKAFQQHLGIYHTLSNCIGKMDIYLDSNEPMTFTEFDPEEVGSDQEEEEEDGG